MAGRRGITPVVAVILLLLMTIAAAGAAYLWITRLSTMITTGATEGFVESQRKQNTRYTLDTVWNESNTIFLVIRNSGSYELPATDFDKSSVYIDNRLYTFGSNTLTPARDCSYSATDLNALGGNFATDTVIRVWCNNSYGAPTGGIFPKTAIRVQPPYGSPDIQTYQYSPI